MPTQRLSNRCILCNAWLAGQPAIRTTTGRHVHLACAEHAARAAWKRRRVRTALSGGLLIALLVISLPTTHIIELRLLLVTLAAAIHVGVNRRWWLLAMQPIRWWCRFGLRHF